MPSRVYNNVVGHRLLDNGVIVEDVTSITLPTITHSTTSIDAAGMVGAVDMPNLTHVDAMDFTVAHNNGTNGESLQAPDKHVIEVRVARQRYDVPQGEIDHEPIKYRITGLHKETSKGNIETGNPYGSTEKYSVLRYEEVVNGKTTVLIDVMAGIIRYNGKDYADNVENMLK